MSLNLGYLTASRDLFSDERYTPAYAVKPLIKYISKDKIIWCPFDTLDSSFVSTFRILGYNVIASSILTGQDFFVYEPRYYDIIISNPPFSIKDNVLERLYNLGKPFAMLLPLNTLQGIKRYDLFSKGIQLLTFDKRICFYDPVHTEEVKKGVPFASCYFCYNFLPKDLIIEKLDIM